MTAPVPFRGVAGTVPGRLTVPVRVPDDLLAEAERIAQRTGEDRAVVLGDLVASALPAALAEAADDFVAAPARERLAGHLPHDAVAPLPEGRDATDTFLTGCTVVPRVAPSGDPERGLPGGLAV